MIEIAVFSFNRGQNLQICVESILRNAPSTKFTVYDDQSDDPATLEYLEKISDNVVVRPKPPDGRHGGLYDNMNHALDRATQPFLMTLQDDTQLVRRFEADDEQALKSIFDTFRNTAFVSPFFIRGRRRLRYRRELVPSQEVRAYCSPLDGKLYRVRPMAYADCHIADVSRLRAAGWRYDTQSEGANAQKALAQFGPMPLMADPLAFHCPDVLFYRNRKRGGLSPKLAGKVLGANPKYLNDLSADEVKALKSRSLSEWPVAEDFLTSPFPSVKKPFTYHDVKARWWLYLLHKLENKLGR